MLNSDDRGIGKKLLVKMIQNKVPGFCTELNEALDVMGLRDESIFMGIRDREMSGDRCLDLLWPR